MIGVLVSGEGTNLQALIDDRLAIPPVPSNNPRVRALERAEAAGIATAVFPLDDYASRDERDAAMAEWLHSHGVRLVVLAGYMHLLTPAFLERFPERIVNVHPSLLPAFPGVSAIEQALDYGVRVTGVTVHFVDERVDTGPVILQEAYELPYARDIEAIEERVHEIEHRLLPRAVSLIASGAVRIDPEHPRLVRIDAEGA